MMFHEAELKRLAVIHWLGLVDTEALDRWVMEEYRINPDADPDLHTLLIFDDRLGARVVEFAKKRLGFEPVCIEGGKIAERILKSEMRKLLDRETTVPVFCKLVQSVDILVVDAGLKECMQVISYPEWLGELWNLCDWCDESWTYGNSPELMSETFEILRKLGES